MCGGTVLLKIKNKIKKKQLQTIFPDRFISRSGSFDWPPRSSDFFCGTISGKVYANHPVTIDNLKNNICAEIAQISTTLCETLCQAKCYKKSSNL